MLRANVGLSRKLSKDYNSTGFSINLEGEITANVNDPEAVIEQVRELFDLAEEAINQQVERHDGDTAIASRDAEPRQLPTNGHRDPESQNGTNGTTEEEAATSKQIQYLLSIAKRRGFTTGQLESRIEEILGRSVGVYDLTKRAAGVVIDALAGTKPKNGRTTSRF